MRIHSLFLAVLLCWGCETSKEKDSLPIIKVYDENATNKIEDFISSVEIVPLQTTDSSLIKEISNIKTSNEGSWYIYDGANAPIKRFDNKGKFLNLIGKRGQGPGEFIQITGFTVNSDTINLFAWNPNRKWITLLNNGTLLSERDMSIPFSDIYKVKNNYLLYADAGVFLYKEGTSEKLAKYLYLVDRSFNILKEFDTKKAPYDIDYTMQRQFFYPDENDSFLYQRNYNDTIYRIDSSLQITPKYFIDFGDIAYTESFLTDLYNKNFMEKHTEMMKNGYPKFIKLAQSTDKLLYTYLRDSEGKRTEYVTIYNKKEGVSYNFTTENNLFTKLFTNLYGYNGTHFYSYMSAPHFLEVAAQLPDDNLFKEIKEKAKDIKEGDNPILVLFKVK